MTDSQRWLVFIVISIFAVGWLLYLLSPVLTPFLIGALLAYLGDPIVDRLETLRLSRTVAIIVVFVLMMLFGLSLLLVLLPVLEQQVGNLLQQIPVAVEWFQQHLLPKLMVVSGPGALGIDVGAVKQAILSHWQQVGGVLARVIAQVTQSGIVLLGWLLYLVLIPVITFYLLRDWDLLVAEVHNLLPRRYESTVTRLARECNEVLAQFLRGQLLVMFSLGLIYTSGLWLVGLDLALLIGVLAGLVSFLPYLGFIVGIAMAEFAAVIQFQDVIHLVYVAGVFGIGHMIEAMVLSPWLVGERIGLHPVAVIFAMMVGGELLGFFGVLLALPVAAIVVVLLRYTRNFYLRSDLYTP